MKSALITGGARRLGRASCLKLAGMGFNIALHYHSDLPEDLLEEIRALGVNCEPIRCDLTDTASASGLVRLASEALPSLELLINSAAIFERASIRDTTDALLDAHVELNLLAPFRLSRDFARIRGKGQIINMIDANAVKSGTAYAAYQISKKGLIGLTEVSAREFAPQIRVNAIAPGLILPPPGEGAQYMEKAAQKRVPLKRRGHADDITRALEFLVVNEFVTGQVLFIDGGEHLR